MVAVVLTTAVVAVVSAIIPAIPIEAYVVGVMATTDYNPVWIGVVAALGQTAGKLVVFLVSRGAIRSPRFRQWLKRRTARPTEHTDADLAREQEERALRRRLRSTWRVLASVSRRMVALLDRPISASPIIFLSALVGIPPLMVTSVYAAGTRMALATFGSVCLVGLVIRFVLLALVPGLWR